MHNIAVLDDIVFPFQAENALGASVGFRAGFEKLIPSDGFSADEVLLQIGMYGPGSFSSTGVNRDCPGTTFVFAGGEEEIKPSKR